MVCLRCSSIDLKKLSLIHAARVHEARRWLGGLILGMSDGLLLWSYRGKNQSRLSKMAEPPSKAPYLVPLALWLFGFFALMAFDGRGKLSWTMGLPSAAYLFLLPVYCLVAMFYNFVVRPKKLIDWENKFMCERCGAISRAPAAYDSTLARDVSGL